MDRKHIRDRVAAIGGPILLAWALVGPGLILWQQHEYGQVTQRVHHDEQVVVPYAKYIATFDAWEAGIVLNLCHFANIQCSAPPVPPS